RTAVPSNPDGRAGFRGGVSSPGQDVATSRRSKASRSPDRGRRLALLSKLQVTSSPRLETRARTDAPFRKSFGIRYLRRLCLTDDPTCVGQRRPGPPGDALKRAGPPPGATIPP